MTAGDTESHIVKTQAQAQLSELEERECVVFKKHMERIASIGTTAMNPIAVTVLSLAVFAWDVFITLVCSFLSTENSLLPFLSC